MTHSPDSRGQREKTMNRWKKGLTLAREPEMTQRNENEIGYCEDKNRIVVLPLIS